MREVIRPFNARMSVGLKPTTIRGLHADGKPCVNTYAWFFDMKDGRFVKASAFYDSVEFNEFWQRAAPTPWRLHRVPAA
jgi:hypothetical protein